MQLSGLFLCLCTVLGYFCGTEANLNLYLNSTETRRLLGIVAQLSYVRAGIINDYALNFTMPIKPHITQLYFVWQSLKEESPMMYNLGITVSNPEAMLQPRASIGKEGMVPKHLSVFRVSLPCSGKLTAEVEVKIQLNVTMFSASNVTTLDLKRKKTCHKDIFQTYDRIPEKVPVQRTNNSLLSDRGHDNTSSSSTNDFYIAVGSACGAILIVALAVGIYYIRSQKPAPIERLSEASSSKPLTPAQMFLRADTPNNSISSSMPNMRRGVTPAPVCELTLPDVHNILGEIQIARTRITLGEVLQEGTFGRVFHGVILTEEDSEMNKQEVIVKSVSDVGRRDQTEAMLREGCLTRGLQHPNVCSLLAVCLEDPSSPLLLYSFHSDGNLKRFLQRCKVSDLSSQQALSTQQLVYMAIQVSRGIQYLHRRRIVHRDVATRNCIVDGQLTVRVTDTALARDLFPNDYHCLGDNENRPVKWLALEALLDWTFTPASDVWSFGVTLWELMTIGQQPYADIDPFEMATYLKEGYRVAQPISCPDELFAVMACCWSLGPAERPKMSQLQLCLQDFYSALGRFI